MKATSAGILEYESLRALLGRYVSSPPGKAELARIAPHTDAARLTADLAEAGEAIEYLRSAARPQTAARGAAIRIDFGGLPDVDRGRPQTAHRRRQPRSPKRSSTCSRCSTARPTPSRVLTAAAERFPRLGRARRRRSAISARCCKDLEGKILPDGTRGRPRQRGAGAPAPRHRAAEASPSRNRSSASSKRTAKKACCRRNSSPSATSASWCPSIAGQRRKLDGVIHGASSSGHTLFVEPLETIDLNNELVRLAEEEAREVHRILLRDDRPPARLRAIPSARRWSLMARARTDLRQGALRHRVRLRHSALRRAAAVARRAPSAARRRAAAAPAQAVVPISPGTRRASAARC